MATEEKPVEEKPAEETPVRSVPKPHFTDAEAGAREFPSSKSRKYNYFEPARQRASVYEDVTVDVQPDPDRHLTQGWVYGFANGPGGYPADWTRLKSSDWHLFRDPNAEWEQTIYRNNANVVRQNQQNLANAKSEGAFARFSPEWLKSLARHVGAWMHAEQGIGMHVFVSAQRDAPTNMINNAISVNSVHKLRFAQDLAMYNLELSESVPGFEGSIHKEVWASAPEWQGVRENAERLTAVADWAEAVTMTNFVFEPLVGELFRSHYVMRIAAQHGDFVTPTLMGAGESDFERDLAYTKALVGPLVADEQFGAANQQVLGEWLSHWIPQSLAAARTLSPIWAEAAAAPGASFDDALEQVKARTAGILSDLKIDIPEELAR